MSTGRSAPNADLCNLVRFMEFVHPDMLNRNHECDGLVVHRHRRIAPVPDQRVRVQPEELERRLAMAADRCGIDRVVDLYGQAVSEFIAVI